MHLEVCCTATGLSGLLAVPRAEPWLMRASISPSARCRCRGGGYIANLPSAPAGQQQFEQQQQHGLLRSRSTTPRAGAQRPGNGRSSNPELADFLDAAAVALWHIPYLRERLTSLQVICACKMCGLHLWRESSSVSAVLTVR